jgi:hypothetical protein
VLTKASIGSGCYFQERAEFLIRFSNGGDTFGGVNEERLTRRSILRLAGLAAASFGAGAWKAEEAEGGGPAAVESGAVTWVLTPELTEGPYYIPNEKLRRNITNGHPGTALILQLAVLDASTCKPIKGAAVDIWHADAAGNYSGLGRAAAAARSCAEFRKPMRAGSRPSAPSIPAGTQAEAFTSTSRCTSAATSSTPDSCSSPTR